MKIRTPDKYSIAAVLFFVAGAIFVAIALLSNLEDITNAAFVISGMACTMTGIIAWMFSGGEPLDPRIVGLLSAQESINLCSLTHHLGIHGSTYFLPPSVTGEKQVMQFNSTLTYDGKKGTTKGSFKETGPPGLVIHPSCNLLIQNLKKRDGMVIPDNEEELSRLISETIEDVFAFAPKVHVEWGDSTVTITFHKYPFMDGCEVIAEISPTCCTMSPCPVCSLCGALIAEGKDKVVAIDRCAVSSSSKDVIAVFSIIPLPDSNP